MADVRLLWCRITRMTFLDTMLFSAPLLAPSETLACQPHVPPDWHKGRQDYAVWLLEIEQNDVQQRLQQARSHLDTWLMDSERQAHITLAIAGFLVEQPRYNDDACPQQLAAQCRKLREQPPQALSLKIGGLDSFASAAFLEVSDPKQHLPGLRQRLTHGDDFRDSPYLPHLTVGLYRKRLQAAQVQAKLRSFPSTEPLHLYCKSISLCRYRADRVQGPLHCIERFPLCPG